MRLHMGSEELEIGIGVDEPLFLLKEAGSTVPICFTGSSGQTLSDLMKKPEVRERFNSIRRKAWWEKLQENICMSPAELPYKGEK